MKDKKRYFAKIIEYIDKIQSMTKGVDFDAFAHSEEKVLACAFSLGQIGEYANKFNEEERADYPNLPWKQIRGMRNVIVHDYDNVNIQMLWDTLAISLPKLKEQIDKIIK